MDEKKYCGESYEMLIQPGSYKLCRCGLSATQPFCDDSHLGTGSEPAHVQYDEPSVFHFCGCDKSNNKPFCDGTLLKVK